MDTSPSIIPTIIEAMPYMLSGVGWTIALIVLSMSLGLAMGIPMAVAQVYGNGFLRRCVGLYVWLFRGVPILVQMYLFYFGIFTQLDRIPFFVSLGLDSGFIAAITVLGLTSAAYQSQIFRGAIISISQGQLKAARSLGMSDTQAIICIILPQALRLSIPGWSNEYSILLKDSALAFVIGVMELMSRTRSVASTTHQPLPLALVAGILFFILTWLGVKALRTLENKVRIPGLSGQGAL